MLGMYSYTNRVDNLVQNLINEMPPGWSIELEGTSHTVVVKLMREGVEQYSIDVPSRDGLPDAAIKSAIVWLRKAKTN